MWKPPWRKSVFIANGQHGCRPNTRVHRPIDVPMHCSAPSELPPLLLSQHSPSPMASLASSNVHGFCGAGSFSIVLHPSHFRRMSSLPRQGKTRMGGQPVGSTGKSRSDSLDTSSVGLIPGRIGLKRFSSSGKDDGKEANEEADGVAQPLLAHGVDLFVTASAATNCPAKPKTGKSSSDSSSGSSSESLASFLASLVANAAAQSLSASGVAESVAALTPQERVDRDDSVAGAIPATGERIYWNGGAAGDQVNRHDRAADEITGAGERVDRDGRAANVDPVAGR